VSGKISFGFILGMICQSLFWAVLVLAIFYVSFNVKIQPFRYMGF
jgi:hypothetical protein